MLRSSLSPEEMFAMIQLAGLSTADQLLRMNKEEVEKASAAILKSLEISPEMQELIDDAVQRGCSMPSLSSEAIEILKLAHGQMWVKFQTEEEAEAFADEVNNEEFFEEALNEFQLRDCFEAPEYMWPDDDDEAYWYINVTEYGRGATNLLKTLGLI